MCLVVRSKCAISIIIQILVQETITKLYTKVFGETLFFYPVANTFSQTSCQIPHVDTGSGAEKSAFINT